MSADGALFRFLRNGLEFDFFTNVYTIIVVAASDDRESNREEILKRRQFAGKTAATLGAMSLAGCVCQPRSGQAGDPPDLVEIRNKFEKLLWRIVVEGADRVKFGIEIDEAGCIATYKEQGNGLWYPKMISRLDKAVLENGKNPTDRDDSDFFFFYEGFYQCCSIAGVKAATLACRKAHSERCHAGGDCSRDETCEDDNYDNAKITKEIFELAILDVRKIMEFRREKIKKSSMGFAGHSAAMCG